MIFFPFIGLWLLLQWACLPQAIFAQETTPQHPITFTAKDFSFDGPVSIPGGWQRIQLVNRGRDFHQILFLKIPAGKTSDDFHEALRANRWKQLPQWVQRHGGVNSVASGEEAVVVINLVPGEYVLICGIPDNRGRPHIVHGMVRSLMVESPAVPSPPPSSSDGTITGIDFSYKVDRAFHPGHQMFRFQNDGKQAHEVVLLKLNPGASTQRFLDLYRPGSFPNPAGKPIGGVVGLDPGLHSYLQVDLKPGRYGLLCFLRDPTTGAPHFVLGMWMDFDVGPVEEGVP